jgi:hypothetical protein
VSNSYIPVDLRRLVLARAKRICEHCLLHEEDSYHGLQVDHIISEKHGGETSESNLALACLLCNSNKGSDIASLSFRTGQLFPFFNPRNAQWSEHFRIGTDGITIVALTDIGDVTVRILRFNDAERLEERFELTTVSRYPSPEAASVIRG